MNTIRTSFRQQKADGMRAELRTPHRATERGLTAAVFLRVTALLAAAVVALAYLINSSHPHLPLPIDSEKVVLAAVLASHCTGDSSTLEVLSVETEPFPARHSYPGIDSAALADLFRRNAAPSRLPATLACKGIVIADEKEIAKSFETMMPGKTKMPVRSGWAGFHTAYPGASGILRVTLPGISPSGDRAVVLLTGSCGMLCGNSTLFQFRRKGQEWVPETSVVLSLN